MAPRGRKKIIVLLLFCRHYYQSLTAIILYEVPYYHNNTLKIGNLPILSHMKGNFKLVSGHCLSGILYFLGITRDILVTCR